MIIGVGSFMHEHREQRQTLQVGLHEAPEICLSRSLTLSGPFQVHVLNFCICKLLLFSLRRVASVCVNLRAHKAQGSILVAFVLGRELLLQCASPCLCHELL